MGQRANLVLVRDGAWSLRYTHWRANLLDRDLFWGPRYATAFVLAQQPREPDQWLDDVWAEGGAVLDHDARALLWFGGEDVLFDVTLRREHLAWMRRLWPGWDVRWANEGIVDIAEYVGVPRERVLSPTDDARHDVSSLAPPEERDWADAVVAVRGARGDLRLFPITSHRAEPLLPGPAALLAAADAERGLPRLDWAEWNRSYPQAGFTIDAAERSVAFWTASDAPDAAEEIARRWPGWTVRWHHDDCATWAAALGDAFRFPPVDRATLRGQLRDALLAPAGTSGPQVMHDVLTHLAAAGKAVSQVNPNAMRDAWVEPTPDQKRELLDRAMAEDEPA